MTWNYRLVRLDEGEEADSGNYEVGVYEVFYDSDDKPVARTVEPASFVGMDRDEVLQALNHAFHDILKYPVLDDSEIAAAVGEDAG